MTHKGSSHSSKSKSKTMSSSAASGGRQSSNTATYANSNASRGGSQGYGSTHSTAGSFGGHNDSWAARTTSSSQTRAIYAQQHTGVAPQQYQHGANASAAIDRVNSQFSSSGRSQTSYYSQHLEIDDQPYSSYQRGGR